MDYGIKNGIMKELEEELCERLSRLLEIRLGEVPEEENKQMLHDLLKGANEVLSKWL